MTKYLAISRLTHSSFAVCCLRGRANWKLQPCNSTRLNSNLSPVLQIAISSCHVIISLERAKLCKVHGKDEENPWTWRNLFLPIMSVIITMHPNESADEENRRKFYFYSLQIVNITKNSFAIFCKHRKLSVESLVYVVIVENWENSIVFVTHRSNRAMTIAKHCIMKSWKPEWAQIRANGNVNKLHVRQCNNFVESNLSFSISQIDTNEMQIADVVSIRVRKLIARRSGWAFNIQNITKISLWWWKSYDSRRHGCVPRWKGAELLSLFILLLYTPFAVLLAELSSYTLSPLAIVVMARLHTLTSTRRKKHSKNVQHWKFTERRPLTVDENLSLSQSLALSSVRF